MPHFPKPFFKKGRAAWCVEIDRHQHNPGPDTDEAFRRYRQLMAQPQAKEVSAESLAAIIDAFLEWTQRKLAKELAPRCSLYALRHSWATHALQKGVDPLTVAILMGHEDPSTLSKVYQHLSLNPAHMLEQARRAVS